MAIEIRPEVEALIRRDVESGISGSVSAEEFVERAVLQFHQQESWLLENREEIAAKIEEGWASAQRGELFSPEQVRERLRAKKQAWLKSHSRA
jgi:predicted transcriptional regulator